jgi:hypothetical protein
MQTIFTATLGRNGSQNLIDIFTRFGVDCMAEHEPPDLPLRQLGFRPFFRKIGWFGPSSRAAMIGRDFQRKFIATDIMMGRGEALEWAANQDLERLEALASKRVKRISGFERRGYRHYLEASPYFLRTYGHQTFKLLPDLGLIKLARDPLENAKSFVNREKKIFANSLPPDHPTNILQISDWQRLSQFQLYLHQWLETELRFKKFIVDHPVKKHFELNTNGLNDPGVVAELFDYFGIAHKPLVGLGATNTATAHRKNRTSIAAQDIDEFHEVLELVPEILLDQIDYLKGFEPSEIA